MSTLWDMKCSGRYDTDKPRSYLDTYERVISPIRDLHFNLLEMGVYKGGSLRLWRDYFYHAMIVGLDNNVAQIMEGIRTEQSIAIVECDQSDSRLGAVVKKWSPFTIIIDDCSHLIKDASIAFSTLFPTALCPGGFYFIEDWCTGYRSDWPEGHALNPDQSHQFGMVGWVKHLIDLIPSKEVEWIHLQQGLTVIKKAWTK